MKIWLRGHNYRYAVEQTIANILPGEKIEYPEGEPAEGPGIASMLHVGKQYTTAVCRYYSDRGKAGSKTAMFSNSQRTDPMQTERLEQYIIKKAVQHAICEGEKVQMPWGLISGVRPGKLMHEIVRAYPRRRDAELEFARRYDVPRTRARLCYDTTMETLAVEQSLREKDICLYVGIPFCPTRCAYCSFISQAVEQNRKRIGPFFEALQQELAAIARQVRTLGLHIVAIYFGGGTPTTLSAEQLDTLCTQIARDFDLSFLREYTVEAGRPDTITEEKLLTLRRHGVDRVSVNPQTMEDAVLDTIGRRHAAQDILDAYALVRKVGGFGVNMDLIAGLPNDTAEGFRKSLETVIALEPENITVHTLSLKRGSALTADNGVRPDWKLPTAEDVGSMLDAAQEMLQKHGYTPYYLYRQKNMSGGYENVGWTKPGHVNIYNICMMEELCTVLAAGGGGSTKLVRYGGGKNLRLTTPKYPLEYIEQIEQTCAEKEKIGEFYGVQSE